MNQLLRDGGNNLPDRGQNNVIAQALAALAQTIENMQPVLVNRSRKQNIAQVFKFNRYGNENLTEWVKRFDAICLMNN